MEHVLYFSGALVLVILLIIFDLHRIWKEIDALENVMVIILGKEGFGIEKGSEEGGDEQP